MYSVVICDDALFMRNLIKGILNKEAFHVVGEAADGKELLPLLDKGCPDLLLLDITLPGDSGLVLLQKIKKVFPDLKVIMCSAMGQQALVLEAIKYGASDFIVKPFTEDKFNDTLLRVVSR